MKKILFIGLVGVLCFTSCDKVENPFPPTISTELDYTLYPGGDSIAYSATEWPVFTPNTSLLRNVMVEDFTGHQCTYCPIAADTAHAIHGDYPTRAFISTIHAGPDGAGSFQSVTASFPIDWTNPAGIAIGEYFGTIPGSDFQGNPRGSVNRILHGGQHTSGVYEWRAQTETAMTTSLELNEQAAVNYYPSTRGVFIHSEIEILNPALTNDLYTVITLMEDSVVAKQKMPDNTIDENYIHRDIMRGTVGSTWQGRKLTENELDNGKYYFNYSFSLPAQYDADNIHLLIYVRDAETEEVYQVIKKKLQ
ncbi:MAG: Omp28-related outer membrane protein [Crocinitomicaceae bacterium]|nr:Omp28-related outer membrane protein [Crocinitomicaceae bacterium]MDG1777183.1 Omp28-related outer membrane protein [Crocinitomicaceae bacterium]